MTTLDRGEDKIQYDDLQQHYDQEDISGYCSLNSEKADSPVTPNISRTASASAVVVPSIGSAAGNTPPPLDEKRMRREIANSNERRRMQSINAGFQSLRSLLPHHEGEKLSKAAILQQTAEYIYQLEQERTTLLSQNCRLKRVISKHEGELAQGSSPPSPSTPSKKRKTTDSCDEDFTKSAEFLDLKAQLERERTLRHHLEEKLQRLDTTLYPITVTTTTAADKLVQESLSNEQIALQYDDIEVKEEAVESVLIGPDGGSPFESRTCSNDVVSSPHSLDGKRTVILHPVVAHEESLISPATAAVLGGHHYAASTVLVNQPACSPTTSIKTPKPKVEVERLPSPTSVSLVTTITSTRATTTTTSSSPVPCTTLPEQKLPPGRVYVTSGSRPNLETLVEAMRHLEGDSLFGCVSGTNCTSSSNNQELPLALTKRNSSQALLQVDMDPFLTFHTRQNTQTSSPSPVNSNVEQQQRPNVIQAVKQQT